MAAQKFERKNMGKGGYKGSCAMNPNNGGVEPEKKTIENKDADLGFIDNKHHAINRKGK